MISRNQIVCVGTLLLSFLAAVNAEPVGTAFTYQGQLKQDGVPVSDTCDMLFTLWDGPVSGPPSILVGPLIWFDGGPGNQPPVDVDNGLFSVKPDFDSEAFNGDARFLQIAVRCPTGDGSFTTLTPRQELTPGPYAIFAPQGGGVGGNTLDQAYDQGGPGAGRTITADVGPVNIAGPNGLTVNGNVGIGTNSPDAKLHLSDPGDAPEVRISGDSVMDKNEIWGAISVYKGASTFLGRTYWNGDALGRPDWTLDTRNVPNALVVDGTTGNVGIGTSSPQARLHVVGDAKFESALDVLGPTGTTSISLGGDGIIQLFDAGVNTVEIKADHGGGNAVVFLKDSSGERAFELHASAVGGGAAATLRNSAGKATVLLDSDQSDDGASLQMFDGTRLTIDLDAKQGAAGGAAIDLYNSLGDRTVRIDADISDTSAIVLYRTDGGEGITLSTEVGGVGGADGGAQINLYNSRGNRTVRIDADIIDTSGIILYRTDGSAAITLSTEVGGVGGESRVTTDVLVISGGSDLSEQFDVTADDAEPKSGMVVCIDPENPGKLKVCRNAYDRTVAGVISGAGGVKTGMLMGQPGSVADGEHPVALTGRVYVLADASSELIKPGDLLTSSTLPGHAMKVADYTRAQGAIVGKAMTELSEGRGLVLVLVSLQ